MAFRTSLEPLNKLLSELFSADEFGVFIRANFHEVVPSLPESPVPLIELVERAVSALARHGSIDGALFDDLVSLRPLRRKDIEQVRRMVLLEDTPRPVQKLPFFVDKDDDGTRPAVLLMTRGNSLYQVRVAVDSPDSLQEIVELDCIQIVSMGTRRKLPDQFIRLPESFVSLGTWEYYENLAGVPELVGPILEGLRDVAWNEEQTHSVQKDARAMEMLLTSGGERRPWHVMKDLVARLRRHVEESPDRLFEIPEKRAHVAFSPPEAPPSPEARLAAVAPSSPAAAITTVEAAPTDTSSPSFSSQLPVTTSGGVSALSNDTNDVNAAGGVVVRGAEPTDTVTLSIMGGTARLCRGLGLNGSGETVWTRAHVVDWKGEHFVDAAGVRHTVTSAMELLPTLWGRKDVERFGQTLSELLFGPDGPSAPARALLSVPPGEQRRLVLDLEEDSFRVPWEYLRVGRAFLAEQRLSIVRHVAASGARHGPLKILPPRIVLFAYANPNADFVGDRHRKQILEEINRFPSTACVPAESCTAEELERLLTRPEGQIFHFLGHGVLGGSRSEASLLVHGAQGGSEICSAARVAQWVRDQRRDLVVLGACFGGATPAGGVMAGIGASIVEASGTPVVAMQMAVPQEFSTAFVARFYAELLASRFDVEVAVYMARRAAHERRSAFGIPVLLADAQGLDSMPELQPAEPGWAQFMPVVLAAGPAGTAWSGCEVVPLPVREAIREVLEREASRRPDAVYPLPPRSPEALREALGELLAALPDEKSRHRVSAATHPAPARRLELRKSATIEVLDDLALRDWVAPERCKAAIAAVEGSLTFPPGLVMRMVGELIAGKHVLLTGPVGTGKTSLARQVVKALGYAAHLETASADWTRFEVQGGFWPSPNDEKQVTFRFRPGVFVEAVLANWREADGANKAHLWRRQVEAGATGTWLILDELNRADMDRALGGVFTALETRRLRVQVDEGTTEIPIPADFRVIATINGADRHFLFRLSDALKRRFAFVHVPVTTAWEDEWSRLLAAESGLDPLETDDFRRFVALVRVLHPLGTALVQGALRFLVAVRRLEGAVDIDRQLAQAIGGSILPNLEDVRREGLVVLHHWATSTDTPRLAELLLAALPTPLTTIEPMLTALATLPLQLAGAFMPGDEVCPPLDRSDDVAAWVARRVGRPASSQPLPELALALANLGNCA